MDDDTLRCDKGDREMQFLGKPLQELTLQDLQSLVDNEVKEGRDIDYKERLPGNRERDRKEFLADASSFANGWCPIHS